MKTLKIAALVLALLLAGCGGAEQGGTQDGSQNEPQASENEAPGSEPTAAAPETTSATSGGSTSSGGMNTSGLSTVTIHASSGEKVRVRVEIADNPLGQLMGLRGRESLPENRGMLFVHSEEKQLSFTMADTPIPLSIAFIDSEKRIIDIQDMKPLDDEPPGYDSPEPAQYALEVNRGFFDERGVKVGDRVALPG